MIDSAVSLLFDPDRALPRLPGFGPAPVLRLPVSRCQGCRLPQHLCICASLPRLRFPTRLVLLIHWREYVRLSNTGLFAWQIFDNAALYVHGHPAQRGARFAFPVDDRTLVLHPLAQESDARDPALTEAGPPRSLVEIDPARGPFTVLVPDGSWPQTRRMVRRIPALQKAARVVLPPGLPSGYGALRHAQRPGQLSTLEAIAAVLGHLEGPEVVSALEEVFERFVRAFLASRGEGGLRS
ncbi:MAG: DTW domain-containing protein [Deltaproteobacteria bacterium]|nr:DTW domain-containing protein [Deltaproteobacteria bacterium]